MKNECIEVSNYIDEKLCDIIDQPEEGAVVKTSAEEGFEGVDNYRVDIKKLETDAEDCDDVNVDDCDRVVIGKL